MASLYQLSSVGKEYSCPRKHMKKLRLYEAIGPARDAWVALSGTVTKYASDHDEEITRGVKRPEGYSISFFMAGSKPSTARPTILISSLNKSERRAVKRVIESLEALAEYPDIAVECVNESVAMLHADGDLPYDVPRNPAHELFVEGGITLCGTRVVAGNSLATLGGAIYLDDGKTITPFGLTVFHAGSGMERAQDDQPEDDMAEFAFDESSDEEEDEDLFENRSRSLSTSQTDTDIDETTRSRTLTESVDLEPKQVAEDSPQESILSPPDTTDDDEETSDGRPPHGLDYQLVSLSGIVCPENMLRIPSQAPIQPKFVAKEAKDVGVWAATSTIPPVRGRLSICPYLLKLPTYSLQKLWVVDLERDIRLGDSGAWIIDESSNVYGHIVAATPGSFRAYILPLHQIFEDIEVFTKCKPSLLSPSEIGSKVTGGIPNNVGIIPYGSGEGEPSGNESDITEEFPAWNLQNEAQKRGGINTLDNSIKPSNTTEPANGDKPAPAGENTPQPTNPKATTEKEQKTQDKSENPDKIEIRGRPRLTTITISNSNPGTSSDSDLSESWEDADALELIEPKIESPGNDAALALIESHRRSMELMSPVAAKRPRLSPRKHPVVPESINKVLKGRSKMGCITCRKRRKKCDETKPRCINCEKNAVVCEGYQDRAIWKLGKEKIEGTAVWTKDIPTSTFAASTAQLSCVWIPNIQLQPMIHGVDTASDRIFFEHYVFRLSAVLTVEGPQKNAFKDMLLPMAVEHLGLMHSILALSSSSLDYQSDYGRTILAKHLDVTENSLCERALFHQDEAVKEFVQDIKRQNSSTTENAVLSVRYGQMLCFVVKSLTEGKATGEHRMHLQAYQKLIRETPPKDSPFMDFIKEYFQFYISVDELVYYPSTPHPSSISSPTPDDDSPLSLPPALFRPKAECLIGVQDSLFYFMSSITRLRNKIRIKFESDIDPIVDYNALYRASQIDASIRAWQSAWPIGEARHIAGLLYKQMLWVYLWRSIYPPRATRWAPNTKITAAVNGALELLRLIPANDPCQTVLLTPTFIIGCAAFEPEQRIPIRESIRRIKAYTTFRNADRALEVLEEVWRYMDKRDKRSWDWQRIASDMGMDFLAT